MYNQPYQSKHEVVETVLKLGMWIWGHGCLYRWQLGKKRKTLRKAEEMPKFRGK